MEINLNFVLFDEPEEKPDGSGAEAHIVMIRESKGLDSAPEDGAAGFHASA
jgi:hypothetical protein